jgi:hypothetical protein
MADARPGVERSEEETMRVRRRMEIEGDHGRLPTKASEIR